MTNSDNLFDSNNCFNESLRKSLSKRFGFRNLHFQGDAGGISSYNKFINADKQEFVLKRYRGQLEKIHRIEAVTDFFYESGLPVVRAIPGPDGLRYFQFESHFFALFPQASGQVLHESTLTEKSLRAAAKLLVAIHQLTSRCQLKLQRTADRIPTPKEALQTGQLLLTRLADYPLEQSIDVKIKQLVDLKMQILSDMAERLEKTEIGSPHLIHGDFHNENLLFDQNYNVACMLDFEHTRFGHRIEDIVMFINLACCNTGYRASNIAKAKIFLASYSNEAPLSEQELAAGFMHYWRELASSFFLENKLYERRELVSLIERDYNRILYLQKHLLELVSRLVGE